ncbi:MAG: helix-turn-helix transcriptional regulator [Lachnospiraceae bacterium]|nr:helix-turn-helix transcriptional regulator [Lachnospiraceae bacterium]
MDQVKIGRFIAELRKEKGLTQASLAGQFGISNKAVSKWENGKSLPDASIMLELCNLLGITVNELLTGERIPVEDYREKAEETLASVVRDSQEEKKNVRKRGWGLAAAAAVLAVLVLSALFYTWPRTIEQRYPALRMDGCVRISGLYRPAGDSVNHEFSFTPEDKEFPVLLHMLSETTFTMRLRNILPGKKIFANVGDYWQISFDFEEITFADGGSFGGTLLQMTKAGDDVTLLYFEGGTVQCGIGDSERWTAGVMEMLRLCGEA